MEATGESLVSHTNKAPDEAGYTQLEIAPIFERLNLDPDYWRRQIQDFGRLFSNVPGQPKNVYELRSLVQNVGSI